MEVFAWPGFLSADQSRAIRIAMDAGAGEVAEILTSGIHRVKSVRAATLIDPAPDVIRDVELSLESCRERVSSSLGIALGEREGSGFLRYTPGGFYRAHRDRGNDPGWDGAARRAVAVVIFLNTSRAASPVGEFDGGVLRLFLPDGDIDLTPDTGTLVAFSADVLHEVTEVRGGTRDAIVDWFYFAELATGT